MNILYVTGMHSTKYGGFEKFNIELLKHNIKLSLIYNNFPQPNTYYEDLKKLNANVYTVQGNILQRSWQVFQIIGKEKPDIIHYHFGFTVYFLFILVKLFYPKSKQVLTQHCEYSYTSWMMRLLTRICYKSLDLVISVSKGVQEKLIAKIGNSKKFIVSYLGVSKGKVLNPNLKKDLNIPTNTLILTSIGFNIDIKGFDILAKAVKLIKEGYTLPPFKIIIIGLNESENLKFKTILKEQEVTNDFISVGIRNDVNDFLTFTDIYLQPSRTEALSLSIMEALMYGIPIIGSKVGGIPEACIDQYNGLLVEKENPTQLAQAIKELLMNKELCRNLGNNSLTHADKFKLDINVNKLIMLYKNLIKNRKS